MIRGLTLTVLAGKYFKGHLRRYLFLFLALMMGYGIITALTALQAGMEASVYRAAQSHYAGDLVVAGQVHGSPLQFQNLRAPETEALINETLSGVKVVKRTQFGNDGVVYFNGQAVRHKYVLGVDWENEADYFSSLVYSDGSFLSEDMDGETMMVSEPVARELGVHPGDRVTLEVKTKSGQVNTASFVIRGIIRDTTIFGYYKCFISRDVLNHLVALGPEDCSTLGLFLQDGQDSEKAAETLHQALTDAGMQIAPLVTNRDELEREYNQAWSGVKLFIITLPVYLSEVADLLLAVRLISYVLYGLMILIILVSVAVTFRLILHEREKELGTLRAIGFFVPDVVFLLTMETLILYLVSLAGGFVLAWLVIKSLSLVSFSMIPSFDIFMSGGRLVPVYTLRTTLINSLALLGVLIFTVTLPVFTASRKPLPDALSGGLA